MGRVAAIDCGTNSIRLLVADVTTRDDGSSWLRDVVVPRPWLAPAGACYAALVLTAELRARREARGTVAWGRDESSRRSHA